MLKIISSLEQGSRSFQSFEVAVKRLEELSISAKGNERVQLLRRWLVALKEVDRFSAEIEGNEDDELLLEERKDSPEKPTLVSSIYGFAILFLAFPLFKLFYQLFDEMTE